MINFCKNGTRYEPTDWSKLKKGIWPVIRQVEGKWIVEVFGVRNGEHLDGGGSLSTAKRRANTYLTQLNCFIQE